MLEMVRSGALLPPSQHCNAGILFFGQHDKDSTVPLVPADIVSATILVATAAHGSTKGMPS